MDLDQVYGPEEDTYLLLQAAMEEARESDLVLEMGCGRGIIAEELKSRTRTVVAADINPHACQAARSRDLQVIRTDMFRGIGGRFDLIIFNPPYLPTRAEEKGGDWLDLALDGGPDGRETVNRFLRELPSHLRAGGRGLLLISSLTGRDEVEESFRQRGMIAEVVATKTCFFETLYVFRLQADR